MGHLLWLGTLTLAMAALPAHAGEIRVVSAEAVRGALEAVADQFSRDTGHKVTFSFMTAGQVRESVEKGEAADIAIASNAVIAGLVKEGRASEAIDLGRIGLAVAVRDGAQVPDLSTPEAFVQALRAARAVSFTDPAVGGTAGIYFSGLLQRLGVAEEVNRKAVFSSGGRDAVSKVAKGDADLAITFPSEIVPIKGARIAGMLPASLQNYTTYAAAVPVASHHVDLARIYIAALVAFDARERWTKAGFEPLN
jgi:molybdate transport system substrate-binding protein